MYRCKSLKDLHNLGLTLDANDPTKAIPIAEPRLEIASPERAARQTQRQV